MRLIPSDCETASIATALAHDVTGPQISNEEPALAFRPLRDLFSRYVSARPLAHALFRAAECAELAGITVLRPVLDVGCGEGEFGSFALRAPPDFGIDLLRDRLLRAQRSAPSASLARADACRLPFGDGSFASVLAVSVLEHVERPWEALPEIARVLRPGGRFVATIVLADVHRHLFYRRWLRPFGLAGAYVAAHDRAFNHKCLLEQADWEKMLAGADLHVVTSRKIVSPRITRAFDLLLATAWPYRLVQGTGMTLVWRPKWTGDLCWTLFKRLSENDPATRGDAANDDGREGSVLLIVAEKR